MKVVFYDADGTVIYKNKILDSTYKAFEELKESGVITVLSTGRSIPSVKGTLIEKLGFDTAITAAGGCVIINNEIVSHDYLSVEEVKEITEYLDKYDVPYTLECNDALYVKKGQKERQLSRMPVTLEEAGSQEEVARNISRRNNFYKKIVETDDIYSLHINKIHWFEDERMYEDGKIKITLEDIQNHLGDRYNVNPLSYNGNRGGGEINNKEITKEKGVRIICEHFGIDINDAYAIGDGYNDLEMLKAVGHSIAMGNADEAVKEECDYVTEHIEDDGFYKAMKHFHLI